MTILEVGMHMPHAKVHTGCLDSKVCSMLKIERYLKGALVSILMNTHLHTHKHYINNS